MTKKYYVLLLVLLVGVAGAYAQDGTRVTKVGTTAAPFLEIGVGSRAVAMGGAFVAMADDATSLYWNPGGISRLGHVEASMVHTEWIAATSFDFAGVVIPIGMSSAIGAHITALNMGEMDVRTIFYPEGTGERFDASDISLALSYGVNLTDRFSIGFNGKFIQQKIWHMKAQSTALDVGTLFTTQYHGLRLGMSVTNFGGKMRLEGKDTAIIYDIDEIKFGNNDRIAGHLDTDKWPLPLTFRVGIAFEVLENEFQRLSVSTDAMHPNNNPESINLGFEYSILDIVMLRGGYKSLFLDDSEEGPTLGGGLAYGISESWRLKVDYAWSDFGILTTVHRFSLGLEF